MTIRNIPVSGHLQDIVSSFWYTDSIDSYNKSRSIRILANGALGIIFQHVGGRSAVLDATGTPLPLAFVYGQSTLPCDNLMNGEPFIFGIDLFPSALKRVFGFEASLATNLIIDLEDLAGTSFINQLLNADGIGELVDMFSRFLSRCAKPKSSDLLSDQSVRLIINDISEWRSKMLPTYFNISPRQFQRKFKAGVGVCPETYIRIVKFQRSIQMLRALRGNKLGDISYTLGYADQSYFNKEFKFFSGYTPKRFREKLMASQPFHEASPVSNSSFRILQQ